MTVAVVMPVAEQRGGGEIMLRQLMHHGQHLGVTWVVIFLDEGPMIEEFRLRGLRVLVVQAGRLRHLHRWLASIAKIAWILRHERASAVVGWMAKAHLYAGPAAILAGRPAIWYQLSTPSRRDRLNRAATAIPCRGILTLSRGGSRAQASLRPVRPQRLIYPGVDLERFDPDRLQPPAKIRQQFGLPRGPMVGIVGRLQRWKGVHVLIEAWASLREEHPEAHCVVVGGAHELEPEYPRSLEAQVAALGLQQHVTLAGLQTNVPEWMQAMDVVVHAADNEPFGIVVIEAMALGKPVIAGAAGGPREIISDGVNGLLVAHGDPTALAAAIHRCLADPEFAARLGAEARKRASEFTAEAYAKNVVSALQELTVPHRQGRGTLGR